MARTAYLHIGPHKTGTTALQGAFAAAREPLSQAGILYPGPEANHSILLASLFWQEDQAVRLGQLQWLDDPAANAAWRAAQRDALAEAIEAAPGQSLVLSGEELSRFSEAEVRALVAFLSPYFDRIRVIAYARAPISCITSMTQQRAKWTGNTLAQLIDTPATPMVRRRFAPWLAVLGRAAFDLRLYGSRRAGFDILRDFCHVLGLPEGLVAPVPETAANLAISWPSVIALAHVNALAPCFVNNRHSPVRSYEVVSAVRLPGPAFVMPRESLMPVAEALADDRDHLNELLRAERIAAEPLPDFSRDQLAAFDPPGCEALGETLHGALRDRQNATALRGLVRAQHLRDSDPAQAEAALSQALALSTCRWSLHHILTEAQARAHRDLRKGLARARLMRLIEAPQADDPPLVLGNPFDRF